MKKIIIIASLLIAATAYLYVSLNDVYYAVKMHTGYEGIPWINGILMIISAIATAKLKFFQKRKYAFLLPVYFFAVAAITYVVGSCIPCCAGG